MSEDLTRYVQINSAEMAQIETVAASHDDPPVIMLNLNGYTAEADYPNGKSYVRYMQKLDQLLTEAGGKVLWRMPMLGMVLGSESIHEAIAIYYPSHSSFLSMGSLPSSAENYRLRDLAVTQASIHRCTDFPESWLSP